MKLHKKLIHREVMMDPFLRRFGEPKSLLKQLKKIDPNIIENLYIWLNSTSNYRFDRWWPRRRREDRQLPPPIKFENNSTLFKEERKKEQLKRKTEVEYEETYINVIIPSDLLNIKGNITYNKYTELKDICTDQFDVKVEVELSCTYYKKLKERAPFLGKIFSGGSAYGHSHNPCLNNATVDGKDVHNILQNDLNDKYKVQYQKGDTQDVKRENITFQYVKIPMTLYSLLREIYIK